MENVQLNDAFIDQIEKVTPKGDGEVLAQSSAGPLVVASRKPNQRKLYVAFRPMNSDFPLQIGFPIFIANALDFFAGGEASNTVAVRTGLPFSVPVAATGKLSGPEGFNTTIEPTGGTLIVRDTRRVGAYDLSAGNTKRKIYAYLQSERESSIAPVKTVSLGSGNVRATQAPRRFADFWRPLALLCLIVLGVEWWMFARRS